VRGGRDPGVGSDLLRTLHSMWNEPLRRLVLPLCTWVLLIFLGSVEQGVSGAPWRGVVHEPQRLEVHSSDPRKDDWGQLIVHRRLKAVPNVAPAGGDVKDSSFHLWRCRRNPVLLLNSSGIIDFSIRGNPRHVAMYCKRFTPHYCPIV
jgi:hypothetical protein